MNVRAVLLAMGVFLPAFTQKIREGKTNAGSVAGNGFEIVLQYTTPKSIVSYLKRTMKDWNGKVSTSGNYVEGKNLLWKDFSEKYFDMYAEAEENKEGVLLKIVVDLGGAYLSSENHPDRYRTFEKWLRETAYELQVSALDEKIAEENKKLSRMVKEQKSMEEEVEDLTDEIRKCEETIKANQEKIKDYREKIAKKNQEIEEQKKVISQLEENKKNIKK